METIRESTPSPLFLLLLVQNLVRTSAASDVGVHWGHDGNKGTLADTCATGKYSYVNIAILNRFGGGQTPQLNLAGHCNQGGNHVGLPAVQKKKSSCSFSPSAAALETTLSPPEKDARGFSLYLRNNFLRGVPLGNVVLDGFDFVIALGSLNTTSPFDYVWVQFYNNPPCEYSASGNTNNLLNSWILWTNSVNASKDIPRASGGA
ncbi:hypothetical protein ABFS83_12G028400 [Erythranthe nasuta]